MTLSLIIGHNLAIFVKLCSKRIMEMEEEIAVFVCSMCGHLFAINNSFWSEDKVSAHKEENFSSDSIDDISSWSHYSDFLDIVSLSQDPEVPRFPLCDKCLDNASEHINRLKEMMCDLSSHSEIIEDYGKKLSSDEIKVQILSPFQTKKRERSNSNNNSASNPSAQAEQEVPKVERNITSRFAQLSAFRLTIDGYFAKINGFRLGRIKAIHVSSAEIQNALLLLNQFLKYQMYILGIDSSNISATHMIMYTTPDGSLELKFPQKSKEINPFNAALTEMMRNFNKIFNSDALSRMRPSILIDVDKKQIEKESYLYSESDPTKFTRAMRKLIVDLKTIQAYQTILAL